MPSVNVHARTGIAVVIGGILMVGAANTHAAASPALAGEWGGSQVRMSLGPAGGRIEFSCAAATIDAAVHPDAAGVFNVAGRHEDFTSGPATADAPTLTTPARFTGKVDGDILKLAVKRQGAAAETYTLQRGRPTKLIRCY